ncbi:MAG: LapD/MoxY N-terminal periplasmic domain-containing protein, partial [Campylobacterota bacterium]|nr:LapD/MoxY N-terminal periplasmic domain-containing protein [Campylobacterota bacterium]
MTLFQQIALVISFFIIVLILSVMVQNFNTANEFVQEQLYSTANDTATSLGLSLSTVDQDDIASIESMISAIYDSGYYALIRFTDMQGNPLFSRSQQIIVKDLPQWFIDYVELETAEATITVTRGWKHIGLLSVKSHSGHAYYQLWQTLQQVMLSFLVLTLLVLAGIYLLLKIVLRPLKKVQIQAEAVIKNNFVTYEEIP